MGMEAGYSPLPSADVAFLRMDRPTNLMVINFVMLFDQLLDAQRLRAVIDARLVQRYPRFRQVVVEGAGRPRLTEDRDFALEHHIHRRALRQPGDDAVLQALVGELIGTPLDRRKPLWEMHLLDRPDGSCALVVRIHHCIVDGIGLAQVMLSLTDATADAPADAPLWLDSLVAARTSHVRAYHRAARALSGGRLGERLGTSGSSGTGSGAGTGDGSGARRCVGTSGRELISASAIGAAANARALAKLLFIPPDARTALRGRLGVSKRVGWTAPLELAQVKATARAQGASVNDVLLAAVSGALHRHLHERGERPRAVRTLVPFNLRSLQEPIPRELGNRFGLVFLTLPVDIADPRERLLELSRRMAAIKSSREGPVSYAILKGIGLTPHRVERRIVDIFTAKASAMTTNVPGPREPVYMAGTRLRAVLVWAPVSGSVGMTVSIFSYHDSVTIGLLADAGLVPDPQRIARHAELELAALAELAPVAPEAVPTGPRIKL
jgi:diacylglycerol O-acyltransferase